jgi:tRNA modification GTPase
MFMEDCMEHRTIAALSTPPGRGGIAVIRISGPEAEPILRRVFHPLGRQPAFQDRLMMYGRAAYEGKMLDECMAVIMRAPRSYTGEDAAEIQVHGSELVVREVLSALFSLGAQPAEPGEFTRRAFLNGRVDLSQAEAVMQLISSTGRQAANAALRQLQGGALRFVKEAQVDLISMMAGVTAALDYPDEIDEEEAVDGLTSKLHGLALRLEKACDERGARILEEGLHVVICGKPNVGKSSLLNALLMEDRAIVTDIPGTTRDLVTGAIEVEGIRVLLMDTAGIREGGEEVERIGVLRALDAMRSADLRLMVLDVSLPPTAEDWAILDEVKSLETLLAFNKADLPAHPGWGQVDFEVSHDSVGISAKTGLGLQELRAKVRRYAGNPAENILTLSRHLGLARTAAASLRAAAEAMQEGKPLDVCAVDLNAALYAIGTITGDNYSEALLDEVFSAFCVGK